jgi:hypothetical protein
MEQNHNPSGLFASMIQEVNVSQQSVEDFKEKVRLGKIKPYFRYRDMEFNNGPYTQKLVELVKDFAARCTKNENSNNRTQTK